MHGHHGQGWMLNECHDCTAIRNHMDLHRSHGGRGGAASALRYSTSFPKGDLRQDGSRRIGAAFELISALLPSPYSRPCPTGIDSVPGRQPRTFRGDDEVVIQPRSGLAARSNCFSFFFFFFEGGCARPGEKLLMVAPMFRAISPRFCAGNCGIFGNAVAGPRRYSNRLL